MHNELFAYNSHLGLATESVCVCVNAFDAAFIVCWTYEGIATNQAMFAICDEKRWMRGHRYSFAPTKRKRLGIDVPEWRLHGWQFKLTQMKRTFIAICQVKYADALWSRTEHRRRKSGNDQTNAECCMHQSVVCSRKMVRVFSAQFHSSLLVFKGNETVSRAKFQFSYILLWCRLPSKRPMVDRPKWIRRWTKKKSSVLNWLNMLFVFLTLAVVEGQEAGASNIKIVIAFVSLKSRCFLWLLSWYTTSATNDWYFCYWHSGRLCELCGHRNGP